MPEVKLRPGKKLNRVKKMHNVLGIPSQGQTLVTGMPNSLYRVRPLLELKFHIFSAFCGIDPHPTATQ